MKRVCFVLIAVLLLFSVCGPAFGSADEDGAVVVGGILPFDGKIFCGSSDGEMLLVWNNEQYSLGLYDVKSGDYAATEPDEDLREPLIKSLVSTYKRRIKDKDKIADMRRRLQGKALMNC